MSEQEAERETEQDSGAGGHPRPSGDARRLPSGPSASAGAHRECSLIQSCSAGINSSQLKENSATISRSPISTTYLPYWPVAVMTPIRPS